MTRNEKLGTLSDGRDICLWCEPSHQKLGAVQMRLLIGTQIYFSADFVDESIAKNVWAALELLFRMHAKLMGAKK